MGEYSTIMARDGHEFQAWLAAAPGRPRGAVVVIQEIFGVNSHIRKVTDGFAVDGDRKSTRLNSSHDQISYAVFCLKKKKAYTECLSDVDGTSQNSSSEANLIWSISIYGLTLPFTRTSSQSIKPNNSSPAIVLRNS